MTDKVLTSLELFEKLNEIIELPDEIVSMNIRLRVNKFATITMIRHVKIGDRLSVKNGLVQTTAERYKLTKT